MTAELEVDFDRKPLLELNIADIQSKFSPSVSDRNKKVKHLYENSNPVGITTTDLCKATGWTGKQTVSLNLTPRINHGGSMFVKSMKVHYRE